MPAFDASKLAVGADHTDPGPDPNAGTSELTAHAYEVRVPNSVESLTVMAEAMSSSAIVSITSDEQ